MNARQPEFKKKETELYNKIRELCEKIDQLGKEEKDTTDTFQRLEVALEEFWLFRQKKGNIG